MDPLISYSNVHSIMTFYTLSTLFKNKSLPIANKANKITTSAITPAYTTTQLLIHNSQPCTFPQRIIDLSILLQNNSKIPISSTGVGHLTLKKSPKRPAWTESHAYIRGLRSNCNNLRMIVAEASMIRALKITRPLKPRRSYLHKRQDEFIWGKSSSLRDCVNNK
ncbi:uncharacterized protein B0P05DRAFT_307115 [Gilbertella persicaria]|uniref:uncharacterized protein n=1 Tax=Gilbertella persicaria TaxID=101096 RepID=UPI00221F5092|nr:uncharacterized protein B0P05DRAFT_307115 [Gilbertella persicaria]KAI8053123.1 hypothetical protein B0P05DRAFT_307115 [Gilbertella persicaria]